MLSVCHSEVTPHLQTSFLTTVCFLVTKCHIKGLSACSVIQWCEEIPRCHCFLTSAHFYVRTEEECWVQAGTRASSSWMLIQCLLSDVHSRSLCSRGVFNNSNIVSPSEGCVSPKATHCQHQKTMRTGCVGRVNGSHDTGTPFVRCEHLFSVWVLVRDCLLWAGVTWSRWLDLPPSQAYSQ